MKNALKPNQSSKTAGLTPGLLTEYDIDTQSREDQFREADVQAVEASDGMGAGDTVTEAVLADISGTSATADSLFVPEGRSTRAQEMREQMLRSKDRLRGVEVEKTKSKLKQKQKKISKGDVKKNDVILILKT